MSNAGRAAIRVEGLGKRYRIGSASRTHGGLRHSATALLRSPIAHLVRSMSAWTQEETLWALRDVSGEIARGDVLGVVGPNGAGKSTLLKILSRITEPTEGVAVVRGRVASLLEVGTGFHPELTGRENIYLNGAILGMRRAEIDARFDEIVAFAEVERFLDTPVKRYSSGMYVRLAFAVAAHLETDVLLVDEVLAVGDVGFQRKCLGRLSEATSEGRTIVFVSHNMASVAELCTRAWLVRGGCLELDGKVDDVVNAYLKSTAAPATPVDVMRGVDDGVVLKSISIIGQDGLATSVVRSDVDITVALDIEVGESVEDLRVGLRVIGHHGAVLLTSTDWDCERRLGPVAAGEYRRECVLPRNLLNAGRYSVVATADTPMKRIYFETAEAAAFEVSEVGAIGGDIADGRWGFFRPRLDWRVT